MNSQKKNQKKNQNQDQNNQENTQFNLSEIDKEFVIMVFYRSLHDHPDFGIAKKPLKFLLTKVMDDSFYPLLDQISIAKFSDVLKAIATLKPENIEVLIDGLAKDTQQSVINECWRIVKDAQEKTEN